MNFDYPCRAKIALTALIALVLLSQSYVVVTRNPTNSATALTQEIASYHARFENARRTLLRQGRVGYIGDTDDPFEEGSSARRAFYLTQYVLSPIVVSRGTEPSLVIGNFREPESRDLRLGRKGLVLVEDFGDGVQLFRHRQENESTRPSLDDRVLP
jgi:hypothetical protein